MQCKDIDPIPVLEFLEGLWPRWACWYLGYEMSVSNAMPAGTPEKVVLKKMKGLIRRGLVSGCGSWGCDCRGDYEITAKGRAMLAEHRGAVPASEHPYYVEAT